MTAAITHYIGDPSGGPYGRPCPRCLEPGIVNQAAHARWCRPDSDAARARRLAAREEKRARRLAVPTTSTLEPIAAERDTRIARRPNRRGRFPDEKLSDSDRRLLDSIRLYELLLRDGLVGTVRRGGAG